MKITFTHKLFKHFKHFTKIHKTSSSLLKIEKCPPPFLTKCHDWNTADGSVRKQYFFITIWEIRFVIWHLEASSLFHISSLHVTETTGEMWRVCKEMCLTVTHTRTQSFVCFVQTILIIRCLCISQICLLFLGEKRFAMIYRLVSVVCLCC